MKKGGGERERVMRLDEARLTSTNFVIQEQSEATSLEPVMKFFSALISAKQTTKKHHDEKASFYNS